VAGRDPQLEEAIKQALQLVAERQETIITPDPGPRPFRGLPSPVAKQDE